MPSHLRRAIDILRYEGKRAFLRKLWRSLSGNAPEFKFYTVLFVNGCNAPSPARYRVEHQVEQLKLWDVTVKSVHYLDLSCHAADAAQVLIFYRCPLTPLVEHVIEEAHKQEKKVYFDVDDLVIDTSYTDQISLVKGMTPEAKAAFDDEVTHIGQTLALCDEAITTTAALADELSKYVPKVHINRNVASLEMLEISDRVRLTPRPDDGIIRLGYFSGSPTHNEDFGVAAPALADVLAAHPETHLLLVGELALPEVLQPYASQVERVDFVDWHDLPALIAQADINLAPLEDTVFNRAKSELKWFEAALVSVPTVASDIGAFHEMVIPGKTGLLCTTHEEWTDALTMLVEHPEQRRKIAEEARQFCTRHCTTIGTGHNLVHIFELADPTIDEVIFSGKDYRKNLVADFLAQNGYDQVEGSFSPRPWEKEPLESRLSAAQTARADGKRLAIIVYERGCGDDSTFRYLGYNVTQHSRRSDSWRAVFFFLDESEALAAAMPFADVMMWIRMRMRPEVCDLAELARQNQVSIAYAVDDNIIGASCAPRICQAMDVSPDDDFATGFWVGACRRFGDAAALADCFIVPSGFLGALLTERTGKPYYEIPNSLNNQQVDISRRIADKKEGRVQQPSDSGRPFRMGYFSGSSSHNNDFDLVAKDLQRLLQECPRVRLVLAGRMTLPDWVLDAYARGQVELLPFVDYVTLQYLQSCCQVVLNPLVVDDFTNCKSALKVFEAGVMGCAALASPTYCNSEAIEVGFNGFLCETAGQWYEHLAELQSDDAMLASMGEHAREKALASYYEQMPHDIETAMQSATETPAADENGEIAQRAKQRLGSLSTDWNDTQRANLAYRDFDALEQ